TGSRITATIKRVQLSGRSSSLLAPGLFISETSDDAIIIPRAFGRSPIEGLVQLGSLTEEEAKKAERGYSLSEYTTLELSQELLRRIQESAAASDYPNKPIDQAAEEIL
ncbi:hypothetical protein, partial [Alistipes putredinis]|uniref:hypothetical protein n=1 Tax=Alistipes putredinis TaxID=28117 RepID=UPI003A8D217E